MKRIDIRKFLFVAVLLVISVCLFAYPFVSNYMFEHGADDKISTMSKDMAKKSHAEDYAEEIQKARKYNEIIANGHVKLTDPFIADMNASDGSDYNSLLSMTDDNAMGYVDIPVIDVKLPVYHGTSDEVLKKGAGHLEGTSLPVGGPSTHSVITGHTGLSSAKLFTDLTSVKKGDYFFLNIMNHKMAYKVDQIKVVLPSELDDLAVVNGKDYCTLLTCTPYGINSHRLLVRGYRVDYDEAVKSDKSSDRTVPQSRWMLEYKKALCISFVLFIAGLVLLHIVRKRHARL